MNSLNPLNFLNLLNLLNLLVLSSFFVLRSFCTSVKGPTISRFDLVYNFKTQKINGIYRI
ncbi:MAG: hypothetical protein DWQ02_21590 [Bacteroidetes bacterium]|nr:MAG: hypothetical protein DWQ02_21590 [Bacteroidota bacterium]